MDVDIKMVDKAIQTDSIAELSTKNISEYETKSITFVTTSSTESFYYSNSSSLPLFRLAKSHQRCSLSEIYFSEKKSFSEVGNELIVNYLVDHDIYMPQNTKCCISHATNDKLNQKSIDIIKKIHLVFQLLHVVS